MKALLVALSLFAALAFADTPPPISVLQLRSGGCDGVLEGSAGHVICVPLASFAASNVQVQTPLFSTNGIISISQSSSTSNGALSPTDWNTFNNKQTAGNYITALTSDVSASGPGSAAATVNTVGGSSAANVHAAELLANAASALSTGGTTIVRRNSSGNVAIANITGNLLGNAATASVANTAATATTATNFSGSLVGDVTGTQSATVVATVGTSTAANVHAAELLANAASAISTGGTTIVRRNASGNVAIANVTGNLIGNASTASVANTAGSFTGSLVGDVTGTQGATVVATVAGSTAANVHSAELLANAASAVSTGGTTIVRRDASGNVAIANVTGNFLGNASTASIANTALNVSGTVGIANGGTGQATVSQAASALTPVTVSISGSVIDWNAGFNFYHELTASVAYTMINMADGKSIVLTISNHGTAYSVSWPAYVKWSGGTAPTQTTGTHYDIVTLVKTLGSISASAVQNF